MLYTPKDYPSVPACVGDDVICQYGRGILKEISSDSSNYTIELSSWRLSGRSNVTCHVTTPPKVVRKHSLSEMDATERVALAKSLKAQAANYFADKDYDSALNTYASAVDKVRNVQHDHTSTNEVRADLVVIMITCSNNAATCCIKLQKWEEASKFAKNALILLDALYGKRGMKIHTILNQEGIIDGKLFGEWRVKSYLVVARACMEQGEIGDAIVILKKARTMGMQFIQELNSSEQCSRKEEKSSLRSLTSQMKEIKRLLEEYTEKKKAAKKIEKKKAKVMAQALFGDGKENISTPNDEIDMKDKEKLPEGKQPIVEDKSSEYASDEHTNSNGGGTATTKKLPFVRKSSLKSKLKREYPPVQQSVSFSDQPPQVKEFERAKDDEDESPWYSEHKEALIMLGIAGFSVVAFVGLRRALR
jgi:tetratricopeptide (TPR) repeat protein